MFAQGLNPFILTQGYSLIAMASVLVGAVINIALESDFHFCLRYGCEKAQVSRQYSHSLCRASALSRFSSRKRASSNSERGICCRLGREPLTMISLGFTPFVMTITECAIQIVFNINLNLFDRWQQGLHRGSYDNAKRTTAHLTPAQRHWKRNAAVCQLTTTVKETPRD